ncbi:MAG: hypothetical protein RDA78_20165 [Roseibium sp.]|uniref:hypothetical protein n=1 Tax=Roseibium sp. TaxID=1936156 RepID=UPI003D9C5B3B
MQGLAMNIFRIFWVCVLIAGLTQGLTAQVFKTDPARFGAMTCQQLWYVEQQTLAEGRVCLTSERAKRAFSRAQRCISSSESVLTKETRAYLDQLRNVARSKGCAGF